MPDTCRALTHDRGQSPAPPLLLPLPRRLFSPPPPISRLLAKFEYRCHSGFHLWPGRSGHCEDLEPSASSFRNHWLNWAKQWRWWWEWGWRGAPLQERSCCRRAVRWLWGTWRHLGVIASFLDAAAARPWQLGWWQRGGTERRGLPWCVGAKCGLWRTQPRMAMWWSFKAVGIFPSLHIFTPPKNVVGSSV